MRFSCYAHEPFTLGNCLYGMLSYEVTCFLMVSNRFGLMVSAQAMLSFARRSSASQPRECGPVPEANCLPIRSLQETKKGGILYTDSPVPLYTGIVRLDG
jgi:hypothetical protein